MCGSTRHVRRLAVATAALATLAAAAPAFSSPIELGEPAFELQEGGIHVALLRARLDERELRVVRAEIAPEVDVNVLPFEAPTPLASGLGEGAVVAVNGGFYYPDGSPMGLVLHQGETVNPLRRGGGSGVFLRDASGSRIVHRTQFPEQGVVQALQSIDRLVADGQVLVGENASPARDARSAVAVMPSGATRFYLVFDTSAAATEACASESCRFTLGQGSTLSGVSLRELAQFLVREGVSSALNLDGGFSSSFEARLGGGSLRITAFRGTINALVARP